MNIAICDDEQVFINNLKTSLDKVSFKFDINLNIDIFHSGEEFIENFTRKSKQYDLIFLDILMKKLNGIETAREIRTLDTDVPIVFLTSTSEFAILGYEVQALNYLLKPINYEKLEKIFSTIYEGKHKDTIFSFNVNHTLYKIPLNHINFFEANARLIYINSIDHDDISNLGFYKKLDDLEIELISNNFVRSHRSYLVNLKNISSSILMMALSQADFC